MTRTPRSILLLLATTAALPAQPQAPAPLPAAAPFHGVYVGDQAADGTTWVRGHRYKLGLGDGGAVFQPLFGPRAPRDYPLTFALAGCTAGGVGLPLAAAAWQRRAETFRRELGGVAECWTVRPDGAQHWFVVDRPLAPGALTLRIDVAGDLGADGAGPGVQFVAAGLGAVHYSDAVAIDAAGRRLALPVEVVAGDLMVTVPASFAAAAAWPLVVDPLLTTFAFDSSVSDIQDAKVACEPTTGNWLVVAEEHLSATSVDVVTWRYDNAVTPVLLDTVYAENGANRANNPDVGFVAQTQQFVVAWHDATAGNFQWRARSATATTMVGPIGFSAGIGSDLDNRPAIGSTRSGDRFLTVLFRKNVTGTDVLATIWRPTGTSFATIFVGPVLFPAQGTVVAGDVSVAASLADKWVVVWRECTTAGCSSQLVRMQAIVSNNGFAPLATEPALTLATASVADHVRIAGHGGNLLAVWRTFDAATNSNDIHGVPIASSGGLYGPQGAVQNLTAQEAGGFNTREQFQPSVSYDGIRFVYGYLEDDGTDLLFPHASTVFVSGPTILWHESHLPLSVVPGLTHGSFDLAASTRQLAEGHHLAVFEQDGPAFTGDVRGALVDARKSGSVFTLQQTGCGLPTEPSIGLVGTPAIGRTFTVAVSGGAGLPLLMVGPLQVAPLPACTGCAAGIDLTQLQVFGAPSLAIDVPADPSLIQLRLAFQGLTLLQTGGCPASFVGFDLGLSDTIEVQIL